MKLLSICCFLLAASVRIAAAQENNTAVSLQSNPRYQLSVWRAMDYIRKNPNSPLGAIFQTADSLQSNAGVTALQLTDARRRLEAEYAQRQREAAGDVPPSFNLRAACASAHALVYATSKTAKVVGTADTKAKILATALDSAGDRAVDNVCELIHQQLSADPAKRARRVQDALRALPEETWRKSVENVIARSMTGDQQAQLFVDTLADYIGPIGGKLSVKEMLETNPELRASLPSELQQELADADNQQTALPTKSVKALLNGSGEDLRKAGEERRDDVKRSKDLSETPASILERQHETERAHRREEIYQASETTALLARQLAPLVGDSNSSKVLLKGANLLQNGAGLARSVDSLRNFSTLSTAVAFTNITSCLSAAISLFSGFGGFGGDDGTSAILEEISHLRQEVQEMRQEMHERFDRLEGELKDISVQMQQGFIHIEALIDAVDKKAGNIQDQVGQLTSVAALTERKLDIYTDEILVGLGELKRGELNDTVGTALRGKRSGQELRKALDKCVNYAKNRPVESIFVPPPHPDFGPGTAARQLSSPMRGLAVIGDLLAGQMPGWSPPPHFNFAEWCVGAEGFARIVARRRLELRDFPDADVKASSNELVEPLRQNLKLLRESLSVVNTSPQATQIDRDAEAKGDPYLQALALYKRAIQHLKNALDKSRHKFATDSKIEVDRWFTVDEALRAESARRDLWQTSPQILTPDPGWEEIAKAFKISNWDKLQFPAPSGWENKIDPIFRVAHRAGLFAIDGFYYFANQLVGAQIGPSGKIGDPSKDPLKIRRLYAIGARVDSTIVMLGCLLDDGEFHEGSDFQTGWNSEVQSRWLQSTTDTLPYKTPMLLPSTKIDIPILVIMNNPATYRSYITDSHGWLEFRDLPISEETLASRGKILRDEFMGSQVFKAQAGLLVSFPPWPGYKGSTLPFGVDQPFGNMKAAPLKFTAAPLYTTARWEWEAKRDQCRQAVVSWLASQKQSFAEEIAKHQFDASDVATALAKLEESRQLLLALLDLGYSRHLGEAYSVREILPPTARIRSEVENDKAGDKLRTLVDDLNTRNEQALQVIQQLRRDAPECDPLDGVEALAELVETVAEQVSPTAEN